PWNPAARWPAARACSSASAKAGGSPSSSSWTACSSWPWPPSSPPCPPCAGWISSRPSSPSPDPYVWRNRMPVDLTPEEMAAFRRGEAPTPMLDLIGLMTCHAIGAARTLGVFDALAAGPLTADELAATVSADPAALEQLLGVLHTTGYVTRQENEQAGGHDDEQAGEQSPRPGTRPGSGAQLGVRYANTPAAAAWLCSDSPTDYGRILGLWQAIVEERWTGLADAVRSGKPAGGFYDWLAGRPDLSEAFHALQRGMAEWLADEV